jgi:ATP-dependent Clp protease ATP-binding subunit ClpX
LFICGGAFDGLQQIVAARTDQKTVSFSRVNAQQDVAVVPEDLVKFGLIPELVGRLPLVVQLQQLDEEALVRILTEPRGAIARQYQTLFDLSGVSLEFASDTLREVARRALKRGTGARGLRAVLEGAMTDLMFELPRDGLKSVKLEPEHLDAPLTALEPITLDAPELRLESNALKKSA